MTNVPAQKKAKPDKLPEKPGQFWTTAPMLLFFAPPPRSVTAGFARLRKRLLIELPWKRRQGDIARVLHITVRLANILSISTRACSGERIPFGEIGEFLLEFAGRSSALRCCDCHARIYLCPACGAVSSSTIVPYLDLLAGLMAGIDDRIDFLVAGNATVLGHALSHR